MIKELFTLIIDTFIFNIGALFYKFYRYGFHYKKLIKKIYSRDKEVLCYDQVREFRSLVKFAKDNIPFYNSSYKDIDVQRKDLKVSDIPILEKRMFVEHGATKMMKKGLNFGRFIYSSGSSGTPVRTFYSLKFHQELFAIYHGIHLSKGGFRKGNKWAMLGGRNFNINPKNRYFFWRYNFIDKQLYLSALLLSPVNARNYINVLKSRKIEFLIGYAHSIFTLAKYVLEMDDTLKLKSVFVSSEPLNDEMKLIIQKAFNCKVYNGYSSTEGCFFFSADDVGAFKNVNYVGLVEILNDEGQEVDEGEVGELVATGFLNRTQPLIRYRTGDYVRKGKTILTICGQKIVQIEEVVGRLEDKIVFKDGRSLVRFDRLFYNLPGLLEAQVCQLSLEFIEIRLNTAGQNEFNLIKNIVKARFLEFYGKELTLNIVRSDKLEKGTNGKVKAVISRIE
jgi:phenylacetate-CoA ligase